MATKKENDIPEANMKIAEKTLIQVKDINNRLLRKGYNNIKIITSIAVDELAKFTKDLTVDELYAYIIAKTGELQSRGIVKENARSIGKKK